MNIVPLRLLKAQTILSIYYYYFYLPFSFAARPHAPCRARAPVRVAVSRSLACARSAVGADYFFTFLPQKYMFFLKAVSVVSLLLAVSLPTARGRGALLRTSHVSSSPSNARRIITAAVDAFDDVRVYARDLSLCHMWLCGGMYVVLYVDGTGIPRPSI